MNSYDEDIGVLTRVIARLEAELKALGPGPRAKAARRELEEARALREFIMQKTGARLPN